MFFRFPPGISLSAKGCPRPKWPQTPSILRFPAPGGRVGQNRRRKKSCAILGRNFWGGRISPPKVPLAPGNCIFVFSARARNFSKCPRPKRAKTPLNHRFRPVGVRQKKRLSPIKLRKPIPDSMVTLFFRFRDPFCSGAQKGPCGSSLLACCCLLDVQAPPPVP